MRKDLKESLMIIAKKDMREFKMLQKSTIDDFLIRYKLFIEEVTTKKNNG